MRKLFISLFLLTMNVLAEEPVGEELSLIPTENLPENMQVMLKDAGYSDNVISPVTLLQLYTTEATKNLNLKPRSGTIEISAGLASLDLGETYEFYSPTDTQKILEELWGNPPDSSAIGLVMPTGMSPASPNAWAVILQYEDDGHVSDDDAENINYDDLIKEMKQGVKEASLEREEQGYGSIELVGWAEEPYYDKATRKMYWAKELRFDDNPETTLNYNIRVLGRKGVLVLNTVAGMHQLDTIRPRMEEILAATNFSAGNAYDDFNPEVDSLAAYGIGALIAGKVAAKIGFFAKFFAILLGLKKFAIIGVIGVFALIKKFFGGSKKVA